MEIFGGFMVVLGMVGLFLAIIWFLVPFVVFSMKGKMDRSVAMLEEIERRLAVIERRLAQPGDAPEEAGGSSSHPLGPAVAEPPFDDE